jgi:sugar lactone lactonase YvrE
MRPSRRRFSVQLKVEALESRWCPSLTLTSAGVSEGIGISILAVDFPVQGNKSAYGVAFPSSGGVLVSDDPGNVRLFASDTDGQSADWFPPSQNYGTGNAVGMASAGGNVYMTQSGNGRVLQLNDDGTLNQVIVSGLTDADGIVANPANGHLFVATQGTNRIFDVDPVAQTATPFATIMSAGLALSNDGSTLYTAQYIATNSRIIGFDATTGAQVFDSGFIAGSAVGVVQGTGLLAGDLFVNTNAGTVVQVDLSTLEQTVIASGGSRGDLMTIDPNDGSALVTQTDRIVRLTFPADNGKPRHPEVYRATFPETHSVLAGIAGAWLFDPTHKKAMPSVVDQPI